MNTRNDNRIRDALYAPPAPLPGVSLLKAILKALFEREKQASTWRCNSCGRNIRASMTRGDHMLISHRFGGIGKAS